MKNAKFHYLLQELIWEGEPLTLARLAVALHTTEPHLSLVFNSKPGRGGHTRRKVAQWFRSHFPAQTPMLLQELGWDAYGNIITSEDRSCALGSETNHEEREA